MSLDIVALWNTSDFLMLSWKAKGLLLMLAGIMGDRAGILDCGRQGRRAVALVVRAKEDWAEIELLVTELEVLGWIVVDEARARVIMPALVPPDRQQPLMRIYFMQSVLGGPIKIGIASDPDRRLASLQTARSDRIRILATTAGTFDDERALHRRFAQWRQQGEWFEPSEPLLRYVEDIQRGG